MDTDYLKSQKQNISTGKCGRAHMNIYAEHEMLNSASCIYFIVSIGFVA